MLTVRGLSRRFGRIEALRDATFTVTSGEILGLIGPNGAGKSTLFQCLAGLLSCDDGEILLHDVPMSAADRTRTLLFLPDGIAPWRERRVDWVLDCAATLLCGSEADAWRGEPARVLRLEELARRRVGELSKGQRKRVLLGLAISAGRPCTLLDEPFDGLDLRHAREVSSWFRALAASGRTLFLSIHDLHAAARLCERLVLLSEGRVVAEGTPAELRARASLPPDADPEEMFLALA